MEPQPAPDAGASVPDDPIAKLFPNQPPSQRDESQKRCPYCGEMILAIAIKCRYCGEMLDKSRKQAEASERLGRWARTVTPSTLSLALIMFCLPWLGLSCNNRPFLQQSGLQASYGGYSPAPEIAKRERESHKVAPRAADGNQPEPKSDADSPDLFGAAPLLLLFGPALIAGIILGVMACTSKAKTAALMSCIPSALCGTFALLLLISQLLIGFPMESWIEELRREEDRHADEQVAKVEYRANLWLTLAATIPSPLLLAFELSHRKWTPRTTKAWVAWTIAGSLGLCAILLASREYQLLDAKKHASPRTTRASTS
jgi:hypothetical protein